ncbi:MAG: hypothetical protein ACK4ND_02915 [Cytophagaceae bacterium]
MRNTFKKHTLSISALIGFMMLSSFMTKNVEEGKTENVGVFSCLINGKPFIIKDMKANMRIITGGHKELSLSNDKFSTFVFINPSEKAIDLSNSRKEAYVRYMEPGIQELFKPQNGSIKILTLDEEKGMLVGEFEMEMILGGNPQKKIKVTEGKFINIPITVEKR